MEMMSTNWKAIPKDNLWFIQDKDGQIIASIKSGKESEKNANLIAASPYLLEALKAIVALIGDEDLPDNGELSGAAISDMARSAIVAASGNI